MDLRLGGLEEWMDALPCTYLKNENDQALSYWQQGKMLQGAKKQSCLP